MRAALLGAALFSPGAAGAVPCEPVSLEAAYAARAASPLPFLVLHGRLSPAFDRFSYSDRFRFALQFHGRRLDPGGGSAPLSTVLIVDGRCRHGDCGPLRGPDVDQVMLALFDDGGLRIEVLPCGTFPARATPGTLARVVRCLDGGCADAN